jgi:uncharacterized membrane protein
MLIAFLPFPMALMGRYPQNPLAVSFFGLIMGTALLLQYMLRKYILLHSRLEEKPDDKPRDHQTLSTSQSSLMEPLIYLVGAVAAWGATPIVFFLYLAAPIISMFRISLK